MNGGKDMSVHHEPAQSVVQAFRSDVKNGLDERQVQENRQRYDENKLKEKKKKTNLKNAILSRRIFTATRKTKLKYIFS